jgi:hypothetical protein
MTMDVNHIPVSGLGSVYSIVIRTGSLLGHYWIGANDNLLVPNLLINTGEFIYF